MNRIIKFRAWDKVLKKWIYFTLADLIDGDKEDSRPVNVDGDLVNWCEFTDLTDKNGKEIYEGDILNWTGKRSKDTSEFAYRYIIIFENGIFGYRLGNAQVNKIEPLQGLVELETYEVIGNIYENPKLLK